MTADAPKACGAFGSPTHSLAACPLSWVQTGAATGRAHSFTSGKRSTVCRLHPSVTLGRQRRSRAQLPVIHSSVGTADEPVEYHDGLMARLFITAFRTCMHKELRRLDSTHQPAHHLTGYDGLLQDCRDLFRSCMAEARTESGGPVERPPSTRALLVGEPSCCPRASPQATGAAAVRRAMSNVLSYLSGAPVGPMIFRWLLAGFPSMETAAAANAHFTPLFFSWLVGANQAFAPDDPDEAHRTADDRGETSVGDRVSFKRRTGVRIERCRFLEQSGCKAMCTHLCQQPVQTFFTEQLGLPLRMTPDFETKRCEMVFGVPPVPPAEDAAANQCEPCMPHCPVANNRTA